MASTAECVDEGMDADEFVALVYERMRWAGDPASVAARELIRDSMLTDEALIELAAEGAAYRCSNMDHRARLIAARGLDGHTEDEVEHGPRAERNGGDVDGESAIDTRHGVAPGVPLSMLSASILELIPAYGADGRRKTLMSFDCADWTAFGDDAKAKSRGYAKRAALAKAASGMLTKRNAATAAGLPRQDREKLEQLAKEAWQ